MSEGSEVLHEGDVVAARYVVESRIGKGGMGAVYAALDQRLGRRVALKALASKWAKGTARQRLEAEARAVALLAHDGIVTLFDVVEHEAELVLVMELVSGESLRARLASGPLAPREVAELIAGIADALGAAHEVGLVHRDVKPDNVIVRPDGRTKLLDFGVATAAASDAVDPLGVTITVEGQVVGTPAYLSPEQLLGEKVTAQADQFALAVTAYELMTGQFPWRSTAIALLASDILSSPPKSLRSRLGNAPPALEEVMKRALEKAPADRFSSIREFSAAFADACVGFAPAASPSRAPVSAASFDPFSATVGTDSPDPAGESALGAPMMTTPSAGMTRKSRNGATGTTEPEAAPDAVVTPAAGSAERAVGRAGSLRTRWWAAAVIAAIAALFAVLRFAPSRLAPSASPSAAASAAASAAEPAPDAPRRIADLPGSATDSSAALERYHEGVRALGTGASDDARLALDYAIRLDPTFASANLQRAYDSFRRAAALDEGGRTAFRTAVVRRDSLSVRDRDLLDAISPAFGDPPDWSRTAERLEAFVKGRPGDEQGLDALAMAHVKGGDKESAEREYEQLLAINPTATIAYLLPAQMHLYADDTAGGRALLDRCLKAVPGAQRCRRQLASSLLHEGECAEADRVAREMSVREPGEAAGYAMRAEASAGLGAPDEAVAELLRRKREALPEARREVERAIDEHQLAVRRGDFDAARDRLDDASRIVGITDDELLGGIAVYQARSEAEAGRAAEAAKIAAAFVGRSAVRKTPERLAHDVMPQLLVLMRDGGALDSAAFSAQRDAWISAWKARTDDKAWREGSSFAWVHVFGGREPTASDAVDGMRARADFHAEHIPRGDPSFAPYLADAGALLIAAGRRDEAEPFLRAAAKRCAIAPDLRATYLLATILEAKGEKKEACAAYAEVERRWGKAKPKSVTAQAARERAAHCPR